MNFELVTRNCIFMLSLSNFTKITDFLWEIPKSYRHDMRVPARVYATENMLNAMLTDDCILQLINVSTLPGIKSYALAMPDAHEGYGFPVGGVAAFDIEEGIISPGGIGYDINCGVRLLASQSTFSIIQDHLPELSRRIFHEVPSGVGRAGPLKLKGADLDKVLEKGARSMVELGYGNAEDIKQIESDGVITGASAEMVSEFAKKRGCDQLGTMGGGNHFVEVDRIETIFDQNEAQKLGLAEDQIVILIHTGSRGLGHQIATDYIRKMMDVMPKYNISIPDRELACVPYQSQEGQDYFQAMSAGANFAFANRQMITFEVRKAWTETFGEQDPNLEIVYDVAHNIAKIEEYTFGNKKQQLIVHRKGATRAFPNQPVLIPGSMGTASYVLIGQQSSLEESFGSTCHGAGRRMSRTKAMKTVNSRELQDRLKNRGILINAVSKRGLVEEAPEAYKDVDEVVDVVHAAGIAKKVAKLRPVVVIKG